MVAPVESPGYAVLPHHTKPRGELTIAATDALRRAWWAPRSEQIPVIPPV